MFSIFKSNKSDSFLDVDQFKEKREEQPGTVIDVRTRNEFDDGHLTITDKQYDLISGEFKQKLDSLDKLDTYYLYCRTGSRSGKAVQLMKDNGFENVYNIGGINNLARAGFEVTSGQ